MIRQEAVAGRIKDSGEVEANHNGEVPVIASRVNPIQQLKQRMLL